jgi:hypothetical protein
MKNLKTTMIAVMLMLATRGEVVAQEKYEYAVVSLEKTPPNTMASAYPTKLSVFSSSGQSSEKVDKDIAERTLIQKVEEFTNNGWEVYQSNSASGLMYMYTYFLRKKKN